MYTISKSKSVDFKLCVFVTVSHYTNLLQPDGTIFPLLRDIVSEGAEDLTKAFTANPKATQELIYVIENFVYNMTDIMVCVVIRMNKCFLRA